MKVALAVGDFLERAATVYGDRVGVVDEPGAPGGSLGELSWLRIRELARAQACRLDELGVAQGERVAILSQNAARLFVSFYGVSAFGRVLVPINFRLNAEEIAFIVEHSGASVLLFDPELADNVTGIDVKHKLMLGSDSDDELYKFDTEPEPWIANEDATASINYTSGRTARPKGVELTHRNNWLNATLFGLHAGVSDRDVYLHTLPMFHANGWGMPFAVTGMGGKHIVLRKIDGAEILSRIAKYGVTLLCCAPAVVAAILEAARQIDGPVPGAGAVRVIVAGAPPPTSTIEAVETELGWELIQIYGLTETAPLLTMNRSRAEFDDLSPRERAQRLGRAGAPALSVEIAVDAEGEILARGNVVMAGYWNQPDVSKEALADGWFHTGDGGYLDEDHYLTISDRKKDVIISGGENVSSIEVEDALFGHEAVAEVAVIGVPDIRWGETVKALVVLGVGHEASEQDLIAFAKTKLAHYKCPTSVEFRDELARTATGKLQKFKLREPYWSAEGRQIG
ncbi:MAG: AMP-binding protein [Acidimicrobiales bacterium]